MTLVRFAPSPTGYLHLGNSRAALVNWLFARKAGGRFLLRLDDTDAARSTAEFAQAIETDLKWLGLDWDLFARQSDRFDRYAAAIDTLKASGRLYPAFESEQELDLKRKLALSRGKPPIYDRAALGLNEAERDRLIAQGNRPHWRFKLSGAAVRWSDLIRGEVSFQGTHLSDPVLVRADGLPLYTLASVVDDIDFGVTHIIRGEDHVANTSVQIELFQALGGAVPGFGHFSLIADADGGKLSKRLGSLSLGALREDGFEPMAVASLLAKLGSSDPIEARLSLGELVAEFDIGKFGRAQPRLDLRELEALNAKILHATPYEAVAAHLPAGADRDFWEAVRPNLTRFRDVAEWWLVCQGPIEPVLDEPDFAAIAAETLPPEPFDTGTWTRWTQRLQESTGRKGRALFRPLRLALTAREHGPDLKALLPLIGRDRVLRRLQGEAC